MGKVMTFDGWLDEIEVFSSRYERLISDFCNMDYDEKERLLLWMKAAYDVGFEEGCKVTSIANQPS